MNGPGDRALKHNFSGVPTRCLAAEGHDSDRLDDDKGQKYTPESQNSARSQLLPAREPGDLDGASSPVVGEKQPREGDEPQSVADSVEESDAGMVPKKPTKTWVMPVESVEGRAAAKGKSVARNTSPTQGGIDVLTALQRIGQRAKEKPKEKWTNLLTHLRVPLLAEAYQRLRRDAATGVDAVTWAEYGERLDARLHDLEHRIHRGSYHPQPVRRVYIPKGDGRLRPLGIPALEDKIVQQAVRWVLEPIYEAEFLGLSYGFRPGRSPHHALDALAVAIDRTKGAVRWVLDADIRSFFDTIDHGWMQRFIEHRIGDTRMVHLLMKWMRAGVMEDGELRETLAGTPQGGLVSPLLANVYLHYALDLWVTSWRNKHAHGAVYLVANVNYSCRSTTTILAGRGGGRSPVRRPHTRVAIGLVSGPLAGPHQPSSSVSVGSASASGRGAPTRRKPLRARRFVSPVEVSASPAAVDCPRAFAASPRKVVMPPNSKITA